MPNTIVRFSQIKDDPPLRVKLFGMGSAGCNMIEGVQYPTFAFSTSSADLARSHADRKILIGADRLVGVSDARQSVLKHLPSIAGHEIVDMFNNTDVAFMFCGLGGLSGSLGVKLFSSIAKAKGTAGIVLAATPFTAESARRSELAAKIMAEILSTSTVCIQFDNDMLSSLAPNMPISRAFNLMNGIMQRPVMDMCSAMTRSDIGLLKHAVGDATHAKFGLGLSRDDDRSRKIVEEAVSSPWFDYPLEEVKAAVAIYSSPDPWQREADDICSQLVSKLTSANIAWGTYADPALKDRIRLSLVICR